MGSKFLIVFVLTTMINIVVWQKYVAADLYDCVDEAIPGYWEPGFWVHAHDGQSVMTVPKINHHQPMSAPDTIKQGWSVRRLLGLWFAFLTTSVVVSLGLAQVPWTPHERSNRAVQQTADRSDE